MDFDTYTLANIIFRRQLYVEGVKSDEAQKFEAVVSKIAAGLRRILGSVDYDLLSDMSKIELQALINEIQNEQEDNYSAWLLAFTESMQEFAYSAYVVSQRIYGSFISESEHLLSDVAAIVLLGKRGVTDLKESTVWSRVSGSILMAAGVLPMDLARGMVTAAKAAVVQAVRKGAAGAKSPSEVLKDILRDPTKSDGPPGVLRTVLNQARSVLDTILQGVSEAASVLTGGKLYDQYRWDSVMDNRTTDICRNLNGQVFEMGKGPIPPAHYNCRSSITQLTGVEDDKPMPGLYDWALSQPEEFIRDILGKRDAAILAAGEMTEEELRKKLRNLPAISVKDFESKAENMYNPN